jgi:hypothetical protein
VPHVTDFEGLRRFLSEGRHPDRLFKAIAVDDNCTGGSSLCHAMRSFNELIAAKDYPITPVKHAVVLFVVKSDNTEHNFLRDEFELHALLSLGENAMAELLRCQEKDIRHLDVKRFKHVFACESSLQLRA